MSFLLCWLLGVFITVCACAAAIGTMVGAWYTFDKYPRIFGATLIIAMLLFIGYTIATVICG